MIMEIQGFPGFINQINFESLNAYCIDTNGSIPLYYSDKYTRVCTVYEFIAGIRCVNIEAKCLLITDLTTLVKQDRHQLAVICQLLLEKSKEYCILICTSCLSSIQSGQVSLICDKRVRLEWKEGEIYANVYKNIGLPLNIPLKNLFSCIY